MAPRNLDFYKLALDVDHKLVAIGLFGSIILNLWILVFFSPLKLYSLVRSPKLRIPSYNLYIFSQSSKNSFVELEVALFVQNSRINPSLNCADY